MQKIMSEQRCDLLCEYNVIYLMFFLRLTSLILNVNVFQNINLAQFYFFKKKYVYFYINSSDHNGFAKETIF